MAMPTDADVTPTANDPFERALAREEGYRRRRSRASLLGFPSEIFNTFRWVALGAVLAWGGLLAVHWRFLGDPRWLAVLHTMVYGLGCIYVAAILALFIVMRRKPAAFGLVDD